MREKILQIAENLERRAAMLDRRTNFDQEPSDLVRALDYIVVAIREVLEGRDEADVLNHERLAAIRAEVEAERRSIGREFMVGDFAADFSGIPRFARALRGETPEDVQDNKPTPYAGPPILRSAFLEGVRAGRFVERNPQAFKSDPENMTLWAASITRQRGQNLGRLPGLEDAE